MDDCWNRIGVRGDGSCPELETHIHCRNCPVYSAAAARLLDAPLPAEQLAQATRYLAEAPPMPVENTLSVVIFRVGEEWLALPTSVVQEIVGSRTIHSLPHRRDGALLGLASIRGELLVCFALGRILKIDAGSAPATGARSLVLRQAGTRSVYPVDEVYGIQHFPPHELQTAFAGDVYRTGVLSWQSKSVSLLDEQLLLSTVNRSLALATTI